MDRRLGGGTGALRAGEALGGDWLHHGCAGIWVVGTPREGGAARQFAGGAGAAASVM